MAKMSKQILRLQSDGPNKVFIRNMNALKHKDPDLFNKIAGLPPNPYYQAYSDNPKVPYNLFYTKDDTPVPYYDMSDPVGVMEKEIDGLNLKNSRIALFLGFGLGYETLYYMSNYFHTNRTELMLLVEKDPYVFRAALETTDLTDIIRRNETMLFVGLEPLEVMQKFSETIKALKYLFLIKCVGLVISYPAFRMYANYYKELISEYKNATMAMLVRYGDSPQDSLTGEAQMFANLKNIVENPGINMLYDAFRGKPAIVCGSGPSLQRELELLKEYQGKILIITAESTLWPLAKGDIYPNIVCTLERDGRPDDYFNDFDYNRLKNTYLAAVPVVPPFMYENFKGPKINAYRAFAHFSWLPFDKGMSSIGASSANMAFKLAHKLGCNPIILIGQDLCFDRETNATHAPGYTDGTNQNYLYNDKQLEIMANDGKMARTTHTWRIFFDNYLSDVPEYHKDVPGGEIINTSEKGVRIPGTIYMPFSEAVKKYLTQPYDPLLMIQDRFKSFSLTNINDDINKLRKRTEEALSDLNDMIKMCDEGVEAVVNYLKEFGDDFQNNAITPQKKRQIEIAASTIVEKKNKIMSKHQFTFNTLVMHVVQPMYISFGINHEEKLGVYETENEKNLFIIYDHRNFFVSMRAGIDEIKKVVLKGQEIIQTLEY